MKIVVGVDGSAHATRAAEWCARHASALDAEVIVVHAIDMPLYAAPGAAYFPVPPISEDARAELHDLATREWSAPLAKASVPFRVVLLDGAAATVIMETARRERADLVVTGRRGRGGFAELLLGSTSHQLSHHCDRPLVIVP